MTIQKALKFGFIELKKAQTYDPAGCATFLLRHALEKAMSNKKLAMNLHALLMTEPQYELPKPIFDSFMLMVRRRAKHEPAWYITNEAYFWRDAFYVDGRVLIPRPETELLVEKALKRIRQQLTTRKSQLAGQKMKNDSRFESHKSLFSIVDVGTGSGVVALSLLRELTGSHPIMMYASDASAEAIEVAKINAARLGFGDEIEFLVGDALEPLRAPVDLIVGNPPYIPSGTIGGLSYDIHHFEPRVALDGGPDGLDVHRKILDQARKKLKKGGAIFLEIGHDQGGMASQMARRCFPRAEISVKKDYQGNDRILEITT